MTARATDSRKRKEDDQKKLDSAKQLELVSKIYGKLQTDNGFLVKKKTYAFLMMSVKIFYLNICCPFLPECF